MCLFKHMLSFLLLSSLSVAASAGEPLMRTEHDHGQVNVVLNHAGANLVQKNAPEDAFFDGGKRGGPKIVPKPHTVVPLHIKVENTEFHKKTLQAHKNKNPKIADAIRKEKEAAMVQKSRTPEDNFFDGGKGDHPAEVPKPHTVVPLHIKIENHDFYKKKAQTRREPRPQFNTGKNVKTDTVQKAPIGSLAEQDWHGVTSSDASGDIDADLLGKPSPLGEAFTRRFGNGASSSSDESASLDSTSATSAAAASTAPNVDIFPAPLGFKGAQAPIPDSDSDTLNSSPQTLPPMENAGVESMALSNTEPAQEAPAADVAAAATSPAVDSISSVKAPPLPAQGIRYPDGSVGPDDVIPPSPTPSHPSPSPIPY